MTPEAPSRNPQTPQTETGRAEHDIAWSSNEWTANTIHAYDREGCPGCALIAKIEAEAAQRVVERIRERLSQWDHDVCRKGGHIDRILDEVAGITADTAVTEGTISLAEAARGPDRPFTYDKDSLRAMEGDPNRCWDGNCDLYGTEHRHPAIGDSAGEEEGR